MMLSRHSSFSRVGSRISRFIAPSSIITSVGLRAFFFSSSCSSSSFLSHSFRLAPPPATSSSSFSSPNKPYLVQTRTVLFYTTDHRGSRVNASQLQTGRDAVTALQSSAKSKRKLDPNMIECVVELLETSRKMSMIDLTICLYSLRIYSINDHFVKELLLALAGKLSTGNVSFNAQAVGNALYGLQNMSSEDKEVRDLLVVLRDQVVRCTEPLRAQAVGNALYGLQNMSSESKEVRDLLVVLRDQVGKCTEVLRAQHVGNALYGLQNMSSESKEVRDLLVVLRDQVVRCTEPLRAQAVGNALYGLQNMSSESKEVRDLLVVLRDQVGKCTEPLRAQAVGNALYGVLRFDLDTSWSWFIKVLLDSISQCDGSNNFVDVGTILQSLCLITSAKSYPLSQSIKEMGLLDEIVLQKNRLAQVFNAHPEVVSRIGVAVNRNEKKYFLAACGAFRDIPGVTLSNNEYIEGFEADIVIRKESSSSLSVEESSSKKELSTIINVELEGPIYKHKLRKKRFCEARDRYLFDTVGVRVVRWELMSMRGLTNEQIIKKFRELVL